MWLPRIGGMVSAVSGWLMARKWGQWLLFYLGGAVGLWINKLVTFAGVALVANNFAVPPLMQYISGPLLSLPPEWINFLALVKVDQAVTIIVSALAAKSLSSIQVAKNPQSPNWTTSGP